VKSQLRRQHPVADVSEVCRRPPTKLQHTSDREPPRASEASRSAGAGGVRAGRLNVDDNRNICHNCNLAHEAVCCTERDRRCNVCRKVGHYAVRCRSRTYVKEVTASASALTAASDEEVYAIDAVTRSVAVSPGMSAPWQVTLFGYGTTLQFKIDSGLTSPSLQRQHTHGYDDILIWTLHQQSCMASAVL